ncbi:MAG: hypothetical protein H7070_04850, partial [Saprospiraceae bacterium]|nr:hypothetical protein [Pyrinomonadaceae bacterium]
MNKKFGIGVLILVVLGAVAGGLFGRLPSSIYADTSLTQEKVVADYREALDVIDKSYVGNIDHEKVSDASIQ